MATPKQNSPYPRNWNDPFRTWTLAELCFANLLRDKPFSHRELCLFAGHAYASVPVTYQNLRKGGRIDDQRRPLWDHPANQPLRDTPKGRALPDLGERPITQVKLQQQSEAGLLAARVDSESQETRGHQNFDKAAARRLLEEWIRTGAAGKDTDRYIKSWLDLAGADSAGPPRPATLPEEADRLLRLLRSARPAAAARAIAAYHATPSPAHETGSHADSPHPGEAPALPALGLPDPLREAEELGGSDDLRPGSDPHHAAAPL